MLKNQPWRQVIMRFAIGVAGVGSAILLCTMFRVATPAVVAERAPSAPLDIDALLTAAHGAPKVICALASHALRDRGWWNGWAEDAPVTPLEPAPVDHIREFGARSSELAAADEDKLLSGLASDDACVQELSVRLLGGQQGVRVAQELVNRLHSAAAGLRQIAAFGLGLVRPLSATDPLILTLHDATPGVRANSAWALGQIEDGRALGPLEKTLRDDDATVREAAAYAVGRLDSVSAVSALTRIVQQDPVASVRRVAAWALGKLGDAGDAAAALASVLGHDSDGSVREMSAWALGQMDRGNGSSTSPADAALLAALAHDTNDQVRETAAWALAESEDRAATDALGSAAEGDRSARVRATAAWALGQLERHSGKATTGLQHVLKDDDEDARLKAAWALGQVGDSSAVPAIEAALNVEHNTEVQRALIRALVKSGGESEKSLTALLNSKEPRVREAAVRALAGSESFDPWPWPWPRPRPFP
jgi:HEAT repeat protein